MIAINVCGFLKVMVKYSSGGKVLASIFSFYSSDAITSF